LSPSTAAASSAAAAPVLAPGGYRNADYMRAGGGMTLLFLVIAVSYIYLFHV
jgi:di/tricarboxylate transporter